MIKYTLIKHAGHKIEINKNIYHVIKITRRGRCFMKKLDARDLKDLNLLKHYRIIRKWASKNNGLTDAELELINIFRLY